MSNKHLIKLWIATLLLAPFVYAAYELAIGVEGQVVTLLEVLPITLIFSVILSLPTLLIVALTNKLTSNLNLSNRVRKLINIILAALGLLITLYESPQSYQYDLAVAIITLSNNLGPKYLLFSL